MMSALLEKVVLSTIVAGLFAIGWLLYQKYFKAPVQDFTQGAAELGEDSPVVEGLLALRDRHVDEGNHQKALEYSSKALERCPTSTRIKALNELDKRHASFNS